MYNSNKLIGLFFCAVFAFLLFPAFAAAQEEVNDEDIKEEKEKAVTLNASISTLLTGSGAYYFNQSDFYGGFDTWLKAQLFGNLGSKVNYYFDIGAGLVKAEREVLGQNELMKVPPLEDYEINEGFPEGYDVNIHKRDIYSYPLAYFPYSYKPSWDGFVFPVSSMTANSSDNYWPQNTAIGIYIKYGIEGNFLNDALLVGIGRKDREAASPAEGYSLVLNKAAQPFFGFDLDIYFPRWVSLHHITGSLEYAIYTRDLQAQGMKKSAATFQNNYSLTMLSFYILDYVQLDAGTNVIWPKRLELGYLFPSFQLLHQNNIGDFDNLAMFGNIIVKYPRLGFVWFSLFVDEINFEKEFFSLARQMYAYQAGIQYNLPVLLNSKIILSYTKIEPYCYTHHRTSIPWYEAPMEQAYVNHGYGLGYYLPPNSDELKFVIETNVLENTGVNLQFQMIRHGAEFGEYKVFGSSYESELKETGRSTDERLRKDFLDDGAYNWIFVIKAGASHLIPKLFKVKKLNVEFLMNLGGVISYWTYQGNRLKHDNYPDRNGIIMDIGMKLSY